MSSCRSSRKIQAHPSLLARQMHERGKSLGVSLTAIPLSAPHAAQTLCHFANRAGSAVKLALYLFQLGLRRKASLCAPLAVALQST